jgi:hypothetical protein
MAADESVLATFLLPMGLNNTRAYKLKRFSQVRGHENGSTIGTGISHHHMLDLSL